MRFIDYIVDMKKLGSHPLLRILFWLIICFIIALILCVSLILWPNTAPIFLIVAVLTFVPFFFLIWLTGLIFVICSGIYLFKHHRGLFKKQFTHSTLKQRYEISSQIRNLKDPFLQGSADWMDKIGMSALKIWLIVYIIIIIAILVLNKLGYLDKLFDL